MAVLVAGIGDAASIVAAVFHAGAGAGGRPARLVADWWAPLVRETL